MESAYFYHLCILILVTAELKITAHFPVSAIITLLIHFLPASCPFIQKHGLWLADSALSHLIWPSTFFPSSPMDQICQHVWPYTRRYIVTGFYLRACSKVSMHISESEISETSLSVLSESLMVFTEYTTWDLGCYCSNRWNIKKSRMHLTPFLSLVPSLFW